METITSSYNLSKLYELRQWQIRMQKSPGWFNSLSKRIQVKVNSYIPEKVHNAITKTIRQMVKGILFGARVSTRPVYHFENLKKTELEVIRKIKIYKRTAGAEGGVTGAGGFLMGFADFPLLLSIKFKMLFDIANTYGFDVTDYKERLYILHIFMLAFSSDERRKETYLLIKNWPETLEKLPEQLNDYDWRILQQEYRDYIDVAKMAQLIPVIGAAVGLVVNYRLIQKLGVTAMNAYRMRLLEMGKM